MANVPTNKKMWDMFVIQAKAKFHTFPSLAASRWVHEQYVKHGGRFVDSKEVSKANERSRQFKKHESEHKKDKADDKSEKD